MRGPYFFAAVLLLAMVLGSCRSEGGGWLDQQTSVPANAVPTVDATTAVPETFVGPIAKKGLGPDKGGAYGCFPKMEFYENDCTPPMDVMVPRLIATSDFVAVAVIDYDPAQVVTGNYVEDLPADARALTEKMPSSLCFAPNRLTPVTVYEVRDVLVDRFPADRPMRWYIDGVCDEQGRCSPMLELRSVPLELVSAGKVLLVANRCCVAEVFPIIKGGSFASIIRVPPWRWRATRIERNAGAARRHALAACGRLSLVGRYGGRELFWCREPVSELDREPHEHPILLPRSREAPGARIVDFDDVGSTPVGTTTKQRRCRYGCDPPPVRGARRAQGRGRRLHAHRPGQGRSHI